jgi:arsenate reductase
VDTEQPFNVLFLCTGNSARSILAEQLVNHWGRGQFRGYSAGSHPKGEVHAIALALLEHMKLPVAGLRSKSWDEFAVPGAPRLDFVLTVCDNAAAEVCPVWPGQPMTAHWGVADPAAVNWSGDATVDRVPSGVPRAREPHQDLYELADPCARQTEAARTPRGDWENPCR